MINDDKRVEKVIMELLAYRLKRQSSFTARVLNIQIPFHTKNRHAHAINKEGLRTFQSRPFLGIALNIVKSAGFKDDLGLAFVGITPESHFSAFQTMKVLNTPAGSRLIYFETTIEDSKRYLETLFVEMEYMHAVLKEYCTHDQGLRPALGTLKRLCNCINDPKAKIIVTCRYIPNGSSSLLNDFVSHAAAEVLMPSSKSRIWKLLIEDFAIMHALNQHENKMGIETIATIPHQARLPEKCVAFINPGDDDNYFTLSPEPGNTNTLDNLRNSLRDFFDCKTDPVFTSGSSERIFNQDRFMEESLKVLTEVHDLLKYYLSNPGSAPEWFLKFDRNSLKDLPSNIDKCLKHFKAPDTRTCIWLPED
jgi:hypothetical protein